MVAPSGAQEPQHIRKPHLWLHLGLSLGRQFSRLLKIFRCFVSVVFLRFGLQGFQGDLK